MSDIRLKPETWQRRAFDADVTYLMDMLPVDSLLYCFRRNAFENVTVPDVQLGGWEKCDDKVQVEIRGQFLGHSLTALSRIFQQTDQSSEAVLNRINTILDGLHDCQKALGGGYLSAFPSTHFDRLEALQQVWAPYYVIHKIMAGLLDIHNFVGRHKAPRALPIVEGMAAYFKRRVDHVFRVNGTHYWQQVLNTEFGGMGEVLYNLCETVQNSTYCDLGDAFQKDVFVDPLFRRTDALAGQHANTHLAQVNSLAAQYQVRGNRSAREGVEYFFDILSEHHSYGTGGNNDGEYWGPPDFVSDAVMKYQPGIWTQETCTVYNTLKVARYLFTWSGEHGAHYADFYERAFLNGILGAARLRPDHAVDFLSSTGHSERPRSPLLGVHKSQSAEPLPLANRRMLGAATMHAQPSAEAQQDSDAPDTDALCKTSADASGAPGLEPEQSLGHAHTALSLSPRSASRHSWQAVGWEHAVKVTGMPGQDGASAKAVGRTDAARSSPSNQDALSSPGTPYGPGQFLYYQPVGFGNAREDSAFHWGDPLESFWCCYGSSVESFSKVADSIFFKDESADVPRLFVNQFVSSTLSWEAAGLMVDAKASLYGPGRTMGVALHFIVLPSTPAGQAASGVSSDHVSTQHLPRSQALHRHSIESGSEVRTLEVLVRVPAWAEALTAEVTTVEGTRRVESVQVTGSDGAHYRSISGDFQSGDLLQVVCRMSVTLERIEDSRPDRQALHALIMGPYNMALLTHGPRRITLPRKDISKRVEPVQPWVSLPAARHQALTQHNAPSMPRLHWQGAGVVSIYAPQLGRFLMLRGKELVLARARHNGDALDASFRWYDAPHNATQARGTVGEGINGLPGKVLEAVTRPGMFLSMSDRRGSPSDAGASLQLLRNVRSNGCEACSVLFVSRDRHSHCGQDGTLVELTGNALIEVDGVDGVSEIPGHLLAESDAADEMLASQSKTGLFTVALERTWLCVTLAIGELPAGAHLLQGDDVQYMIAPFGNLIDEKYSTYLELGDSAQL